ncbi:hypothetical protein A2955_04275 [Candidatus Woesebacteria bacterium RIFCSPLOWO2_01_FULL_37_19]|uniref:Uncharacterized protein n=2 Tax=Candidatus Woeseibacteriota TaxID=1752722 RepID=A0A1F8B873_9BACT|nr:MAG: hypothetical protein A2771_03435 [Candidatus Woesebacteria bacterium RIFCSPHIGHO2_01_FULL_38_26b]OGM60130.1 MAG: hypothetical protein A2955_04275 [Candidatus Woesebacteria bacterium RIFCSPLOWO2_01_FULL_37_19]
MNFKIFNKKYFLIFLAAVVVIIISVVITQESSNSKNKSGGEYKEVSLTPTETLYPIDDVNDGVYTNSKYGYKFEYPKDKFEQTFSDERGASWIYKLETGANGNEQIINLTVLDQTNVNDWIKFYSTLYSLEPNKFLKNRFGKSVKLSSKEDGPYKTVTLYFESDENSEAEQNASFQAIWFKDDSPIIVLQLLTDLDQKQNLKNNKPIFDSVIKSFTLLQ